MRISGWCSDVCSSALLSPLVVAILKHERLGPGAFDLASEAAQFSIPQEDHAAGHRLRVNDDALGQALRVRHFQILLAGRVVRFVSTKSASYPIRIHFPASDRDRKSTRLNSSH